MKKLDEIMAYQISSELSNRIWSLVIPWDFFAKDTIGKQLVRAADSVPANIAEGFGRYHKKDKIKFYYNARGSAFEVQFWLQKARKRNLISEVAFVTLFDELNKLPRELNYLIKITNINLSI